MVEVKREVEERNRTAQSDRSPAAALSCLPLVGSLDSSFVVRISSFVGELIDSVCGLRFAVFGDFLAQLTLTANRTPLTDISCTLTPEPWTLDP